MTVILTSSYPDLMLMTVDSAVSKIFNNGEFVEYESGRKAYYFEGVGCVATWGSREANQIGEYLRSQNISPQTHTVDNLAFIVSKYLNEVYQPDKMGLDDVGYHVAGFDTQKNPCLYHIYWAFERPIQESQVERNYVNQMFKAVMYLYNGRNDLVDPIVNQVIYQMMSGKATRFNLTTAYDRIMFHDFVIRFASEITPEVDKPFYTFLITPENKIEIIKNDELKPLDKTLVLDRLIKLGIILDRN